MARAVHVQRAPSPPPDAVRTSVRELKLSPGVVLREATYRAHGEFPMHFHDYSTLFLVLEGAFTEWCSGVTEPRTQGMVRFIPRGVVHANRYGGAGVRCFLVEVAPDEAVALSRRGCNLERTFRFERGTLQSSIAHRLHQEFRVGDDLGRLSCEGLFLELVAGIGRSTAAPMSSRHPHWLACVRQRLHDEFRRSLTLTQLAVGAGIHPARLVRGFRQHYACTPAEYATRLRIEHAKHALIATEWPIAAVAAECGFTDQAHFSRRFRAMTGTTPKAWRESHRLAESA